MKRITRLKSQKFLYRNYKRFDEKNTFARARI